MLAAGLVTYLLAFPVLYRQSAAARKLINRFGIPVPEVRHVLCYVAMFGLVVLMPSVKRNELRELGACGLFLLITLYPFNGEAFSWKTESN